MRIDSCRFVVCQADLFIQGPEIINNTNQEESTRYEVEDSRDPLPLVKPVDTKNTKKCKQDPGYIVINWTLLKMSGCVSAHCWNKE